MIKATAGGGGRGMRPCFEIGEFISLFRAASNEALAAFGNGECYLEKLVINPHHIEFQIIADSHGNYIHLGERDCSMQRRNQKIIEECPSPLLTPELRQRIIGLGIDLNPQGEAAFMQFLSAQIATWGRVVRENNIRPD
jgi:acetyl-CoA carboxylase biotin carboxylase subunit